MQEFQTRDYFCQRCYYFMLAVEEQITSGRIRAICGSCRKHQVVDLSQRPVSAEEARARRASHRARLREAVA